jgi:excinuclease ABC subunit C
MNANTSQQRQTRLAAGVAVIREYQRHAAIGPGVYRMLNAKGTILYIGKARSIKARIAAYTRPQQLPVRLQRMIAETVKMEFTSAQSEAEALLLEAVLIKEHLPRYNILLRDDKSFPYIYISGDHEFPRIAKHRGSRAAKGDYFGPFMTAGGAVEQTINALQRAFLIRNCSDAVFQNRSRPCLQYFIQRCSAPCVDYIDRAAYAENTARAKDFLRGKHGQVQAELAAAMQTASQNMDYEQAARLRDRIKALSLIQSKQRVHIDGIGNADIIALLRDSGQCCIYVVSYRDDQYLGGYAFYPKAAADDGVDEVLLSFLLQYYDDKPVPPDVITSHTLPDSAVVAQALSLRAGRKITLHSDVRGKRREALALAEKNASEEMRRRLLAKATQKQLLTQLAERFALLSPPERIEIYDNSHLSGQNAVGVMVVAGPDGFVKKAYRKFNFPKPDTTVNTGGDDYAMLRQVLTRRFARIDGDANDTSAQKPDLLLIDGGLGQLGVALDVLRQSGHEGIAVIAIAKGADRNAGRETLFMDGQEPLNLPHEDPVLHFLQRLRDEAHRFAIGGHRQKRSATMGQSELDAIEGIGAVRKRALLHHFGSVLGIKKASLADLQVVKGINAATAKKIYGFFHSGAD